MHCASLNWGLRGFEDPGLPPQERRHVDDRIAVPACGKPSSARPYRVLMCTFGMSGVAAWGHFVERTRQSGALEQVWFGTSRRPVRDPTLMVRMVPGTFKVTCSV